MKKCLSVILALVMLFALTSTAFAYTDDEKAALVASKTSATQAMYDGQGWKYEYNSSRNRFKSTFDIDGEMETCTVWAFVYYDTVEFNADYPVNAPADMVDDVAVFFTRINQLYRIGGFYMEYDSGLMGYKIVVYTEEADPTYDALYWGLRLCVEEVEMVGDVLNQLLLGELTVDEAYEAVANS